MSESQQISDKALERIRKLLAMANDARGNENESAVAAAKAQSLMAELGIELHMLEARQTQDGTLQNTRAKAVHDRAAMYAYQQNLMSAIAETHFCRHWLTTITAESFGKVRRVKRHQLLGRAVNVKLATELYDYLIDTMDRILPYQGMDKRGKDALLWLDGCSTRLIQRLQERFRQQQAETEARKREEQARARHPGSPPSGALVTLSEVQSSEDDLNSDYVNGRPPGTTARMRAENEARRAEQLAKLKAREADLIEAGIPERVAYFMTYYGDSQERAELRIQEEQERAEKLARQLAKSETDAQRRKRERAEQAYQERWQRRYNREYERQNTEAYRRGSRAGGEIGLDTQLEGNKAKDRLG